MRPRPQPEVFAHLCDAAEPCLKSMLLVAQHTSIRKGEIGSLRWDQVDFNTGPLRLKSGDIKTGECRVIPLNQALTSLLKSSTRYLNCLWMFVDQIQSEAWQVIPKTAATRYHQTMHQLDTYMDASPTMDTPLSGARN